VVAALAARAAGLLLGVAITANPAANEIGRQFRQPRVVICPQGNSIGPLACPEPPPHVRCSSDSSRAVRLSGRFRTIQVRAKDAA